MFEKGNPGGPGRPQGCRNRASLILDALANGEAETILRTVVEAAKAGDLKAADMLLARIWPARRGRPVEITLPAMKTAADLVGGLSAIAQAVSAGELTPEEAQAVAGVLETQRRAIETEDLAKRIAALEEAKGA